MKMLALAQRGPPLIASLMIEKYLHRTVKRKDIEERMINGNLINGKQLESERGQGNILPD